MDTTSRGGKMGTTDTVTISREEYLKLLSDRDFVNALKAAGVDNWEGYDYARELMQEDIGG